MARSQQVGDDLRYRVSDVLVLFPLHPRASTEPTKQDTGVSELKNFVITVKVEFTCRDPKHAREHVAAAERLEAVKERLP